MGLFRFFGSAQSEELTKEAEPDEQVSSAKGTPAQAQEPARFHGVAVLEAAGVDAKSRDRVERTLDLLQALPADASPQLRKNIVEASLKAFDVSINAIVESASREVEAFDAYIAHGQKQLNDLKVASLARIAELEAEIAGIQTRLEVATFDQAALDQATLAAIRRVLPVLDFFGKTSPLTANAEAGKLANQTKSDHLPSIIIDESLMKTG